MSNVKVSDAVAAVEEALKELKELPQDAPINGNFDQGGYGDCDFPLRSIGFDVSYISQEEINEDYDEDDEDAPSPEASITAVFISN